MPINLPNGLVAPEAGDSESLACESIESLFRAVDALQTQGQVVEPVPCTVIPASAFILQGDPDCSTFEASTVIPAGVDASKSALTFYTATGERVYVCYSIAGGSVTIETNDNVELTVVYA